MRHIEITEATPRGGKRTPTTRRITGLPEKELRDSVRVEISAQQGTLDSKGGGDRKSVGGRLEKANVSGGRARAKTSKNAGARVTASSVTSSREGLGWNHGKNGDRSRLGEA